MLNPPAMDALFVYAAAAEAGPLADDPRTLALGVGKVAAATALTRRLLERRPAAVVAFGVAGAYRASPAVGEVCVVGSECFGDEGVATPDGFVTVGRLGLADDAPRPADAPWIARLVDRLGNVAVVAGATVSTCSGTDAIADAVASRTGADIETMEGAAIAHVCAELGVPWVGLRAISNRTGDRDRAGWDLARAAAAVQDAVRLLWEEDR